MKQQPIQSVLTIRFKQSHLISDKQAISDELGNSSSYGYIIRASTPEQANKQAKEIIRSFEKSGRIFDAVVFVDNKQQSYGSHLQVVNVEPPTSEQPKLDPQLQLKHLLNVNALDGFIGRSDVRFDNKKYAASDLPPTSSVVEISSLSGMFAPRWGAVLLSLRVKAEERHYIFEKELDETDTEQRKIIGQVLQHYNGKGQLKSAS